MTLHENFGKGNKNANPNLTANDVVYTPREIARQMIGFYNLTEDDRVLDPCAGDGSFFDQYPKHILGKYRMEITEGLDFFDWDVSSSPHINWIITNPPYSIYEEFAKKAFEVADNVCFLVPLSKIVSSLGRIQSIMDYGGFVSIHIIGASKCGFPFGFPAAAVHMKRGYEGETKIKILHQKRRQ